MKDYDEVDALKAQVEQLRIALKATRQPHMDFIPTLNKTAQQILDATPDQCLAERDAEILNNAVFNGITVGLNHYTIEQYANQLRQQAKGDE